jgi:predicted ATPase
MIEKAVTYLLRAAERAQKLSAHHEANHHLSQGLAQLASLPDSLPRARQELALQIALGNTLLSMKGSAAADTGAAYERAYVLGQQVGQTPQIFAALYGLRVYHNARGESQRARAEAEQLLHLAQNQPDPVLRVLAHHAFGETLYYLGELGSAREQLEQGILYYHPQNHLSHVLLAGQDVGVACLTRLAMVLWLLGYPEQALQRGQEALILAQTLAHPRSLYTALLFCTGVNLCLHDGQVAQRYAEAQISLAAEQGFALHLAAATYFRGLALVNQGKQEGIAQMQLGLNGIQGTGSVHIVSFYLAGLAEGHANAGQTDEGLNLLAEALARVDKTGNRFWEAELYRLKGEMLLMHYQGKERAPIDLFAEVEACYQRAIEIARRQRAKAFELRATTSLCRLWQAQGKGAEAHALLAEIYHWFTEGFDTADLIEAKTLLDALT